MPLSKIDSDSLSTPLTVPAGSAAAPAITTTGDTNTGIFFPAADTIAFAEGGVESMRIDSSGNVVIGSTTAEGKFEVRGHAGAQSFLIGYGANGDNYYTCGSSGIQVFRSANTERARIDSSGNMGIGSTTVIGKFQVTVGDITPSSSGNMNGFVISKDNAGNGLSMGTADTGGYNWISSAYTNGGGSGRPLRIIPGTNGVQLATGGTSWTSLSDERFKTDLTPILNASDKVASLRSVTGRFKTDEAGTSRAFLIAQDVQTAFPEAVDASDPERLGVQYTEVIPLLVAAIQELKAIVDAQGAEIAALKGTP